MINDKSLSNTPLIIFKHPSNGNISQINANPLPTSSFEKYIPLVKHTSCTTILPIPPVALSLTRLPIKIPNVINNIETISDINIIPYLQTNL